MKEREKENECEFETTGETEIYVCIHIYLRNGMFLYFYGVVFRADRTNAVEGTHQKINKRQWVMANCFSN